MRLKSLKLAGFKSFANSTTFTFARGITAIVGPNGCGKSNVIDAIRWVLGETSAKQLRGGAMSDVIFAGTQEKSAKSVASVELTFEHTQDEQTGIRHEFNLYHELSVRRQVNLEGRSDYFINGTRCRRRDVVDVFLGTGLGARSYAVIEQGMIGRIVESSPLQLREFIEEAAGVSRYQARRLETQKKLEITQDNLARLHDMQSELTRQQKSLAKQASNAELYNELNATLAQIKQQLAIQQLYQVKQQQLQQKQTYEGIAFKATELQASYEQIKAKQDKLTAHINQQQWLKDEAQSQHYQQQLSFQKSEYQLNDIDAKLTAIEQQLQILDQQRQQSTIESEALQVEQIQLQTELKNLSPQLDELSKKRDHHKSCEQPLQRVWIESQNQLSRLQDSVRTLEQQQAINSQAQKRQQLNQDKLSNRQQSWQELQAQHLQGKKSEQNNDSSIIDNLENKLEHINRQQESVSERIAELQPQAHSLQQRLTKQLREVVDKEKSHALLAGEYDTLHKVLHPVLPPKIVNKPQSSVIDANNSLANSSLADDAKSILSSSTLNSTETVFAISTLREQIELSEKAQQHAELLDKVLALWLDSEVLINSSLVNNSLVNSSKTSAEDSDSATTLGQALKSYLPSLSQYQNGHFQQNRTIANAHSLWLPIEQTVSLPTSFTRQLPAALIDKVLPFAELIIQPALALWQHCYLYINAAKTTTDKLTELTLIVNSLPPSALLLTDDGWIISSKGAINFSKWLHAHNNNSDSDEDGKSIDSPANSHFLSQRLQQRQRLARLQILLDESDREIERQQQTLKQSRRDYDALQIELEESRAQNEQLTRDNYQSQQQLVTEQTALKQRLADTERLNAEKIRLEQEQQELALEQNQLDNEQLQIETKLAQLIPKVNEAQTSRQLLQTERNELSRNRQSDDAAWQALQLTLQKSEIRLEHNTSRLVQAKDAYDKTLRSEQELIVSRNRYQQQLPELQTLLQTLKLKRDAQQVRLSEREDSLSQLKQDYSTQQTTLDTLQSELQNQQNAKAAQATELALSEARLEEVSLRLQGMSDTISVSSLIADFIAYERRVRPDKITELQDQLAKLEQQLIKIGAVNLAAVAELAQVNERLEPLTQQTQDIAASMQTLTQAISSIDETTKTLFMQTLEAVNSELSKLFAKVFGGGQASLTLSLEDMPIDTPKSEQWRAGLTLMAQPKGKRNSRLAVLSGGEKTLTALSLIFAIFKQHPAPFCVLDEVDAPLDDANVERFTSLIYELASDLQFIFISHNKLSMQIADELKGITMPSAGISTLVSVSLDEAANYIEDKA